jgi:S1-C subfamily serine protease
MTSGLVIHVSAGDDKYTEVLTDDRIRLGHGESCNLRLRSQHPAIPSGPILELARSNGYYRVTSFDRSLNITHNGNPLEPDALIDDGDEVRIGASGISLQFFPVGSLPVVTTQPARQPHVAPFIEQAALESAATARPDDAKVFLREFTRELIREISLTTKLITLVIAVALVGGILYLGFAAYKEIQQSRRLINDQSDQLKQAMDQLKEANNQIRDIDKRNRELSASFSFGYKVRSEYGNGVCLIAGSYMYVESGTGRPLKYPETKMAEDGSVIQGANEQPCLTPEGKGPVFELDFAGTGFHVGNGYILTNRHVVQPWTSDDRAQGLASCTPNGVQPRLTRLMAYFPEQRQPFALKVLKTARRDDLAVGKIDDQGFPPNIPALPLEADKNSDSLTVGKSIVMMGYPSGADRLLTLLPEDEARNLNARCGASLEILLGCLAERNSIKPLTTRGSITDLYARRIVYDAATAQGGSGAPVFGQSARVIGVNFAVDPVTPASNFAVPISYAITLLQDAGWKLPEQPADKEISSADQHAGSAARPSG